MDALNSKILSLFLLFISTILFGILAHVFFRCKPSGLHNNKYERILHLLNSFAGGVFLGTCLLHLLSEGREELVEALKELNKDIDYPIFEACVAVGFFVIVVVDYIAYMCLTSPNQKEKQPLPGQPDDTGPLHFSTPSTRRQHCDVAKELGRNKPNGACICLEEVTEIRIRDPSTGLPHDHEFRQLSNINSGVKAILLLVALSFHTIFDGLAVGLQNSSTDVWQVMIAVAIHKSLVAFSLGLQLFTAYNGRPLIAVILLFVFSVMSPIGLGIGIGVTSGNINKAANLLTSAILQAFATGTFLYVTFFEILRECFMTNRSLWNILICVVGFSAMAGVKLFDKD